jgi:hypothetical protein
MASRVAGAALLVLGMVLAVLGAVGLLSLQLVIDTGGTALLLVLGLVCITLGMLIWSGNRLATAVGLVLLIALLVLQVTSLVRAPVREVTDWLRLVLTVALAALLALAVRTPRAN